jgi:hypothetical protein
MRSGCDFQYEMLAEFISRRKDMLAHPVDSRSVVRPGNITMWALIKAGRVKAINGLWCCNVPTLRLPAGPSRGDAETALELLRQAFRTFPFGDAERRWDAALGVEVLDTAEPSGRDESAFLTALLTAVCRPSLWLAPGMLVTAPAVS